MMNYEEFKIELEKKVIEAFEKEGGDAPKITPVSTAKVNQTLDGLAIQVSDGMGIAIYVNPYYAEYVNGRSLESIATSIVSRYHRESSQMPQVDATSLRDYESVKDKLYIEVISQERNEELLEEAAYTPFSDLAIIYRILCVKDEMGRASTLITDEHLKTFGVTLEQLHEDAVSNSADILPVEFHDFYDAVQEATTKRELDEDEMEILLEAIKLGRKESPMFIATVSQGICGASVIAYPRFFEMATELCGGSFYVLPSSRHEVLLRPDKGNIDIACLEETIQESNTHTVLPEDFLSDNLYHYDCYDKQFEIVEDYLARVQA